MSKIIFMGDSITAYMPYIFKGSIGNATDEVKYFGVENIGVGSYMNFVWPKIDHDNVDVYILLIGINNISRPDCDYDGRETLDDLIDKLKGFINCVNQDVNSRLLVQSIYPTKRFERIHDIKHVNTQLMAYCTQNNIEYLDLYSLLIDDNELLDNKYSDDGIHPNELGYSIIANEINKKLTPNFNRKLTNN